MANINRDYLIIADLKSGKITNPTMSFYNTDKNIANLFVKLQITMSNNPNITGFVNKEEASNYNVKLTVIKPKTTMLVELEGVIQDSDVVGNGAVYLFDMPQNFTDQVGKYICELEITCMVNGREEIVTCDPFRYTVKESAVTGLNVEIEPNPDVPVLKQLINEVRAVQENGVNAETLTVYQKKEDDTLNTNDKTVVGGINELNTSKVDKVEGKGLSTVDFTNEKDSKLNGIAENANNYTHPTNHEPNIITQDATHRFVTDKEKETWNNKLDFSDDSLNTTSKNIPHAINELDSQINTTTSQLEQVKSDVETLKNKPAVPIETVQQVNKNTNDNKRQDFYINALYNENADGRLSVEEEGNDLKLEGSKQGLVEIEKVVGNTMATSYYNNTLPIVKGSSYSIIHGFGTQIIKCRQGKLNDIIYYRVNLTLNKLDVEKASLGVQTHRDDGGYNMNVYQFKTSDVGKTLDISTTRNIDTNCIQLYNGMSIGLNGELPEGTIDGVEFCNFTTNDYMVVNLTEVFGSGNEPTKEWCDKNISYFEGMQSTFEDKLITQEMIDSGEELAENLGKYRVGVTVRGKNLIDIKEFKSVVTDNRLTNLQITENSVSFDFDGAYPTALIDLTYRINEFKGKTIICRGNITTTNSDAPISFRFVTTQDGKNAEYYSARNTTITIPDGGFDRLELSIVGNNSNIPQKGSIKVDDIIIVNEKDSPTPYEPYKEYKTSILLGSPLLKGDEIVYKENGLCHWHKMGSVVLNGSEDEKYSNELGKLNNGSKYGIIALSNALKSNYLSVYCDKLPTVQMISAYAGTQGVYIDALSRLRVLHSDVQIMNTANEFKAWLQNNPIKVVYELAEPYFEPITPALPKWVSEMPNNATLHIDSIIPCQSVKASYTGKLPSVYKLESDISTIEEQNVDIIATSWDTDYRVCEIEWVLEDAGLTTPISLNNIKTGGNTMALSRFEQAKIIILGDAYYRPTFQKQLETYLKRNYLTQEEFDTLISMMDAREAIKGEIV